MSSSVLTCNVTVCVYYSKSLYCYGFLSYVCVQDVFSVQIIKLHFFLVYNASYK